MAKKRAAKRPAASARRGRGRAAKPAAKRVPKATKRSAKKRVAKRRTPKKAAAAKAGLLTLTEVSKRTGISMPTLQRYKKLYQHRLATVGKGRTQRYRPESLATFEQIKEENLKKRGRPRKKAAKRRPAARRKATPAGLISLSEIGRRTGISYPTLLRYVRLYGDQIPSHGTGRKRRFPVEAVPVFRRLRKQSRRGRRKGGPARGSAAVPRGLEARLRQLEKRQAGLERQLKRLVKVLQKPLVKGL